MGRITGYAAAVLGLSLVSAFGATPGFDYASSPAYPNNGNFGLLNGGGGAFGAWSNGPAANSGTSGSFIGTSLNNGNLNGPGINSAANKSWGIYANTLNGSEALRPLSGPLKIGQTISVDMDNGWIEGAGSVVVFGLQTTSGVTRFETLFRGGDTNYSLTDAGGTAAVTTSVAWTDGGIHIDFTLKTADTYDVTVRRLANNVVSIHTNRPLAGTAGSEIGRIRFFNFEGPNDGNNPRRDAFINNLQVSSASAGLTQRIANATLRMPSTLPAETTNTYVTSNAFPGVTFSSPVAMATPPGETNRLFVLEQAGVIAVITNLANPNRTVFMDIQSRCLIGNSGEGGLLGLAFHPGYGTAGSPTNRYFYVYYTASVNGDNMSNRVSRFETQAGNPNLGDTNSEVRLINQRDDASNHNAGDVHFGPDGYLYVTLGDEGGGDDNQNNSQTINKDFFSGVLRIDVDKKAGSLSPNNHAAINAATTNYAIPSDNPFIGVTSFNGTNISASSVRTEFYAIGLRNPFRMAFDEITGELYLGDVGQDAREEVDYIVKGGNYGWAYREGLIAGPKTTTNAASIYRNPAVNYTNPPASSSAVTGGRVYRGDRFPDLLGKYVFADVYSGNIYWMTNNTTNASTSVFLANDDFISAFGRDPRNNDLLMADLGNGQIKRLERVISTNALPATLSEAGVFSDLQFLTPYPGIVPYDLNVPFWSDGASKSRWFTVPPTNLFITFDPEEPWIVPTGTVWIKHFDLPLITGVTSSVRRIETRILVKNSSGAGGYGVTYRWGTSTTNATLVPDAGLDEPIVIDDGGTIRTQVWHYPSRSECLQCHKTAAGFALGFNTVQLNRDYTHSGVSTNQLRALNQCGYFNTNVTGFHLFRKLASATNTSYSVEYRARSYLQANCRQCHFPGPANWDARVFTPLSRANIVNGPLLNDLGDPNNRVIVPGVVSNSVLHTRINVRGANQMPPLASTIVDTQGVALVAQWINAGLASYQSYADWQIQHFGTTNNPDAGGSADPDGDGNVNDLEYLTGSDPTNFIANDTWAVNIEVTNSVARVVYPRIANRGFDVQTSTGLVSGAWSSIDVPENTPFFSSSTTTNAVPDPASTNRTDSYYRVRVYEP